MSSAPGASIGKTRHLGPCPASSTRIHPFLFENWYFFSGLAYRQHVSASVSGNAFFQNARVETFENAGFSFTCGRTQTEVFEYDDAGIHLMLPAWSMLSKGCYISYFHCFSVFVWTGENDSDTLRVGVYFLKTEKKISVFKNIKNFQIRVDWG